MKLFAYTCMQNCKIIKRAIRSENSDSHEEVLRTITSMAHGCDSVSLLDECEDCLEIDDKNRVADRIALFISQA